MDNPAFHAFALTTALLSVHLILLAFWTGGVRARTKTYVNPEDSKVIKGDKVERDHVDTVRTQRMHMNALENAVPFFAVGALYVSTGATATGAQAYCYTFLAMRILHSIFYHFGVQPFRTITFGVGALAILGMAYHVIRAVV